MGRLCDVGTLAVCTPPVKGQTANKMSLRAGTLHSLAAARTHALRFLTRSVPSLWKHKPKGKGSKRDVLLSTGLSERPTQ